MKTQKEISRFIVKKWFDQKTDTLDKVFYDHIGKIPASFGYECAIYRKTIKLANSLDSKTDMENFLDSFTDKELLDHFEI